MEQNDFSIADILHILGYNSLTYFGRVFKNIPRHTAEISQKLHIIKQKHATYPDSRRKRTEESCARHLQMPDGASDSCFILADHPLDKRLQFFGALVNRQFAICDSLAEKLEFVDKFLVVGQVGTLRYGLSAITL